MNPFLNLHNAVSLIGAVDLLAHSVSFSQENEQPQNIKDIFIPKSDISVAEHIEAQIDDLGNNIFIMYQFIGDINDTKVLGLEPLLNFP